MESIIPGVPDRGGNDHYAMRGRLAWQPGDATDVDLIVRYLKADKETQAGIYSHEPACPNAEFQGEFTPPDLACAFWGTGPGESRHGLPRTIRSSRAAAAIRGRPRRPSPPTSTARSSARRCASTPISAARPSRRSRITRRPRSSTPRAATRRRTRACTSSRAATSTRSRRNSACRGPWATSSSSRACSA